MPFTFAHPAAVIPLRQYLCAPGAVSACVIGSMAPDFVYWLPLPIYRETSHTIPALFTFCLPVGFIVFWLYHTLINPPLLALLPHAITVRLPPIQPLSWHGRHIALVLFAVLLGAATHIAWDACTHYNTPVTRLLPVLEAPLLTGNGYVVRVYKVLQHGSTIVGFGVLASFGWRWYQRTPPRRNLDGEALPARQKVALVACLCVPSVIGAIRSGLDRAQWEISLVALQKFLMSGAVAGIGIFSIVLLTLGLLWPLVKRRAGC